MRGCEVESLCLVHILRRVQRVACAVSSMNDCTENGANELNIKSFNWISRGAKTLQPSERGRLLNERANQIQRDTPKPRTRDKEMKLSVLICIRSLSVCS